MGRYSFPKQKVIQGPEILLGYSAITLYHLLIDTTDQWNLIILWSFLTWVLAVTVFAQCDDSIFVLGVFVIGVVAACNMAQVALASLFLAFSIGVALCAKHLLFV